MSTKMQVQWRRAKVLELSSQGYSQSEISKSLQVDESVISRDRAYLRQGAQENLKTHYSRQTGQKNIKTVWLE